MDSKTTLANRFIHDETGQSIIETAFLLSLVLLIIMVFISLSYGYYYRTNIQHLATNVATVLSLSEIENNSANTTQRINDIVSFYESNLIFPIYTSDSDRFTISWEEEVHDLYYTVYSVRVDYIGPNFPLTDPINISVTSTSLKVEK
ncbi:MAG: pilus assembly protein [Caldisericia bacterium]|nr:pilus assembly protein [Caldisericia bacterium]